MLTIRQLFRRINLYRYTAQVACFHQDDDPREILKGIKDSFELQNRYTLESTPIKDPVFMFKSWFADAKDCRDIINPSIMCLATSTPNGTPSLRYMFCDDFSSKGFTFFTHHTTRKGQELEINPQAAMCFFWGPLLRTVRIEGPVEKLPQSVSDELFDKRSYEVQVNIHCSSQTHRVKSCNVLKDREVDVRAKYDPAKVPRPENFGWYKLQPNVFEFWQLRGNKERVKFRKAKGQEKLDELTYKGEKDWVFEYLEP